MSIVFWACAAFVLYVYLAYPLLLWLISKLTRARVAPSRPASDVPGVTVIVSARNEAGSITRRVQNFLDQDYPLDKMEIIVVSDGSTDDTAELVRSVSSRHSDSGTANLSVIELTENRGKPNALNLAVRQANHDILIMADARQRFAANAVSELVNALNDPATGCVSGELLFEAEPDAESTGVEMGVYWKYERFIRRLEARWSSVVGMTGAIYAMRRDLYVEIPEDTLIDDVLIPMNVVRKGYRAGFESSAVAYDAPSTNASQEWKRKVRTMAGNWQLLQDHRWLLSPIGNPLFLQFFSHKVGRLLVPLALAAMLISSLLVGTAMYWLLAGLQVLGYLAGLSGVVAPASRNFKVISLAYFFALLNASVIVGFVHNLRSDSRMLWTDAHKDQ